MMRKQQRLSLVFRCPCSGNHSIERVFGVLERFFAENYEVSRISLPLRSTTPFALIWNIVYARWNTCGIVHVTGDVQYLAAFLPRDRVVLTIHDCGHLMNLRGIKRKLFAWLWFRLPCRRAKVVTTISNSTREALVREARVPSDRIRVVENCVTCTFERTQRPFHTDRPRILQIGSGPHKNLDTLIGAVQGLNCELRIVGRVSEENRRRLQSYGIKHEIEFDVSDERLEEIYRESDILYFASRHEGFGLPILEAQTVGIPVITSTTYSMPHVAGAGAILVDPESVLEVRNALGSIINNAGYRQRLVEAGFENVLRFSPQAIAARYEDVYHELGSS